MLSEFSCLCNLCLEIINNLIQISPKSKNLPWCYMDHIWTFCWQMNILTQLHARKWDFSVEDFHKYLYTTTVGKTLSANDSFCPFFIFFSLTFRFIVFWILITLLRQLLHDLNWLCKEFSSDSSKLVYTHLIVLTNLICTCPLGWH